MSKDNAAGSDATAKKPRKKLLIMIIAAVLLLGGGAGGYAMFTGEDGPEPPPEPGIVIPLEAITINLTDGHFLKISIALQATAEVTEELDGSKALDILISEFSNRSVAELSSNGAREEAKKHLIEKIGEAYEGEVMGIYFTQFVMQ